MHSPHFPHSPHSPHSPAIAAPTTPAPESHMTPVITTEGRTIPLHTVPRYDRTILLLINGRRTITDLAQLTRRGQADVYASLNRLAKQHLITLH